MYHDAERPSCALIRLPPDRPDTGTNLSCGGTKQCTVTTEVHTVMEFELHPYVSRSLLKPTDLRKSATCPFTSLKRALSHSTASILFTATTISFTPSECTSVACSLVCPLAEKASSNSLGAAGTTRTATSAWAEEGGGM